MRSILLALVLSAPVASCFVAGLNALAAPPEARRLNNLVRVLHESAAISQPGERRPPRG
jgi:hypothetical protein